MSSGNAFSMDLHLSKILFGKALILYHMCQLWALPIQQQIKIWSQKYGQIGIQLSDWVENIVGKEEIALYEQFLLFPQCFRVPRGSVVRCLTRNPGVLGSSLTRSSGFFRGSVLGQDTSEPSLVLVKPRKAWIMWAVAVIWLKYC